MSGYVSAAITIASIEGTRCRKSPEIPLGVHASSQPCARLPMATNFTFSHFRIECRRLKFHFSHPILEVMLATALLLVLSDRPKQYYSRPFNTPITFGRVDHCAQLPANRHH